MFDFTIIGEVLQHHARQRPYKIAFKSGSRARTFGELFERSRTLTAGLRAAGVAAGDRVAVLSKNSIEFIEVYGVSGAGMIPVPLNWRLTQPELLYILEDCRPSALIHQDGFSDVMAGIKEKLSFELASFSFTPDGAATSSYERLLTDASAEPWPSTVSTGDTACLVYTSGTTGRPKGAELTHRGLLQNAKSTVGELLHLTENDTALAVMPLFHVGGMWYHLFPSFAAGCTSIILPEFDPALVLKTIARERATNVHLVPTMIHALLASAREAVDLSSLRVMFYAGSTMPSELLRRATSAFSCDFVQGYGSTEAGQISCLSAEDHRKAVSREALLLSCGRPLRGVRVRLTAEAEGIGEIAVHSGMTMARYWRNPAATHAVITDDWLHTGDLARRDDEGYCYIVDRKSDMIVSGGENVYPREVEEVLSSHPAVSEAAVFDLPDEKWVQRVVAAVVLKPGIEIAPADLIADTKSHLASYKCPKDIFIDANLPKNAVGKVLRRILRERYANTGR